MLRIEQGFERPDAVYDTLMRTFDGLTDEQVELAMARLILLLANHIGDSQVLTEAMTIARDVVTEEIAS
jgi:hypothetical protein